MPQRWAHRMAGHRLATVRVVGTVICIAALAACSGPAASPSGTTGSASGGGTSGGSTAPSTGSGDGVVSIRMVSVGAPGNPSVGVVTTFVAGQGGFVQMPTGAEVYASCGDAPTGPPECYTVGGVDYPYLIGETEVTVGQYTAFLNTADPEGSNLHGLYQDFMNPQVWPKYGSVAYEPTAASGKHYSVAYPEWEDKPFGFANFLRAARFDNSLYNGKVESTSQSASGGFTVTTYQVRLSPNTETGMYDMSDPATTRRSGNGFVIPSDNEWLKAAYYDPKGGGTHSYWLYPTGPSSAPAASKLDPRTGDVINSSDQPISTYSPQGPKAPAGTYPTWCPSQVPVTTCNSVNPGNLPPGLTPFVFQGNVSTVGQTGTRSPWGTLDQGGNVVEWQDTIVPSFQGYNFQRVWRRMHGGVANAPAYQMLINALGFQPQDQVLLDGAYPWFGIRVGAIGNVG